MRALWVLILASGVSAAAQPARALAAKLDRLSLEETAANGPGPEIGGGRQARGLGLRACGRPPEIGRAITPPCSQTGQPRSRRAIA